MTGHTTDIEGGGSLEVGAWDQRQRGIGRHFSMVKQFYIFIVITFLLLRFSCMYTMYSTCSQLHPSQLPLFPGQFPNPTFFSPLVSSHPYLFSSMVNSPTLPPLFSGQLPNPLLPHQFHIPTSSLPWSSPHPCQSPSHIQIFLLCLCPSGFDMNVLWLWGWNYPLESGEYTSGNMVEDSDSPSPRVNQ